MAVPVIVGTTSGGSITSNTYAFTPTLPSGSVGDLLICIVSVGRNHAIATVHTIPVYWFQMYYAPDVYHDCSISIFLKYATNNSEDTCYFTTQYFRNAASVNQVTQTSIYSKPSWICYRISGAYIPFDLYAPGGVGNAIYSVIHGGSEYVGSSGTGANWNLPQCPVTTFAYNPQKDFLWICAVASRLANVATVAAVGFSDLITRAGSEYVVDSSSISTCTQFSSIVKAVDPGAFTSPSDIWSGIVIRLQDDIDFDPDPDPPDDPSIGVGTYIYKKEAYVYVPDLDSIEVIPVNQYYNSDGTPDTDLNYFGYYVEVMSTGDWTCAWNTGTYFTAGQYSGNEGVTYVAINCVGQNESAGSYTDTLVFDGPGISMDSVNVEQYNI